MYEEFKSVKLINKSLKGLNTYVFNFKYNYVMEKVTLSF